jgi:hypothetical protein
MKKSELLREAASLLKRYVPFAYDEIEAVQEAYDNEVAREMRERNYEPKAAAHGNSEPPSTPLEELK